MHTPEEASALWCPMVRVDGENWSDARGARGPQYNTCIAGRCAMWRWEHTTESVPTVTEGAGGGRARTFEQRTVRTHGYCGLAPLHVTSN